MYNLKEKSMKKTFLVLAMMLISFMSYAQRIAVLDFNAGVGVSQADVDGISAIFNTYFSPKGYTLVERTQIDKAIDEQNFQRGRFTESQMVKIGQILNVSNVVIGDINIVAGQYNVDVRVINVQSGTIQATEGATWAAGSSFRNMMNSLATKLADKIAINPMASSSSSSNSQIKKYYNHEYVDLGLSVNWSTCNYGATSAEGFGKYMEDDQAYDACELWGGSWRLPTESELRELVDYCTWTWTTKNGTKGYKVTGPNGNSIFLPAAGAQGIMLDGTFDVGIIGYYWSCTYDGQYKYNKSLVFDYEDNSFEISAMAALFTNLHSARPVFK